MCGQVKIPKKHTNENGEIGKQFQKLKIAKVGILVSFSVFGDFLLSVFVEYCFLFLFLFVCFKIMQNQATALSQEINFRFATMFLFSLRGTRIEISLI